MRIGTILKIVAALVVAIIVAGVAIIATIDVNKYKDVIIAQVKTATGRDLTLDGDLEMAIGLNPAVVVNGASLSNAPWAGDEAMLSVDKVEAQVALLPALTGSIQVDRLVIVKPRIVIATKGGKTNLDFEGAAAAVEAKPAPESVPADAEATSGAPALPAIGALKIEDGRLIYRDLDAGTEEVVALEVLSAEADSLSDPLDLILKGAYGDIPFDLTGRVGAPDMLDSGTPYPLALKGAVAGIDLSVDGTIAEPMAAKGLDLKLAVQADSLDGLKPLAGDLPALPPLALKGRLTGGGSSFSLADLDLSAGKTKLTGAVGVALGGARPKADLAIQAAMIDLPELLPKSEGGDEGGSSGTASDGGVSGSASGGRVIPDTPLPLDALKAADATFDVSVAKLILPDGMEVDGITAKGKLVNGRLDLTPVAARMGDGTITADAVADASSGKSLALDAAVKADKVVLGRLFEQIGRSDLLTGSETNADIKLTGAGATPAALAASLNGKVLVVIGEGRIHEAVVDWAGADVLNQLADSLDPDKDPYASLTCGVVNIGVKDGVLSWDKEIAFQTSKMNVISTGGVDLGPETLDIAVRPYAREGVGISAGKLAEMVRLTGTLSNPSIGLDAAGLARNAASIAGALATGGVSLLGEALFDNMSKESEPCKVALGQKSKTSSDSSSGSGSGGASPAEAPKQIIEGLGKGLGGLFGK